MVLPRGMPMLMLVDDEPAGQRLIKGLATRAGWKTVLAADAAAALAILDTQDGQKLDVVLVDNWKPCKALTQFIVEFRRQRPTLPLVVMIGDADSACPIAALQAGATNYVHKPVAPELLLAALNIAIDPHPPDGELRPLSEKLPVPLAIEELIGSAPRFRNALAIAAKAARARAPVLIEGETGTGKEVIANAIHAASARSRNPMITLHCATVGNAVIGSSLFGHEQGAFPGAFNRQTGKLNQADMGTIFIDQIEHMPLDVQARLVDMLDHGEVQAIGGTRAMPVDVRVIAAADTPLKPRIATGEFREDLYYKLGVVQIELPPLRERTNDISALVRHLLARMGSLPGIRSLGITADAMQLLLDYAWPGNVRQLQTALFRAALACEGDALTPTDFPQISSIVGGTSRAQTNRNGHADGIGVTLYLPDGNIRPLEDIEADVIRLAIGQYRGRMSEVARRLGIGRSTLYRKLADLGIDTAT